LVFEGVTLDSARLTIPHPRMLERAFVIIPLAQIAEELVIKGRSCGNRADEIDNTGVEKLDSFADWWR